MEHAAQSVKQTARSETRGASGRQAPAELPPLHPMLQLQRDIGNQAVLSLLRSGAIRAKLAVGSVDDPLEHEADSVADQVMRMPDPALAIATAPPQISRKCAACEEEDAKTLRTKSASGLAAGGEAPSIVHDVIGSPGQPLDPATRSFFEPRFGRDFSHVRMHSDARAGASAQAVRALAYTVSNHIVVADGHATGSESGRRLLAHELTHTLQQSDEVNHAERVNSGRAATAPSPIVQRQAGTAPDPGKFNQCKDLLDLIKEAVAVLLQRASDLLNDPLGLQWDNWFTPKILPDGTNVGSVVGHQQQYEGWRNRLRNQIDQWNDDDCNSTGLRVPQDVRDLVFKPAPAPIPRPRPESGPKPWTAPGSAPSQSETAKRLGAAAEGAAIGATAGLVLGGVVGAIVGGAGGTLVAPGVGTVGVGAAGAVAGAEAGAPVGAAIGAAVGGVVAWLEGD